MSRIPRAIIVLSGIVFVGSAYGYLHLQAADPRDTSLVPVSLRPAVSHVVAMQAAPLQAQAAGAASVAAPSTRAVLDKYCVTCHNQRLRTANLTLDKIDLNQVGEDAVIWEKVVQKLRSGAMPPPRMPHLPVGDHVAGDRARQGS
jgi:cytochrome c5